MASKGALQTVQDAIVAPHGKIVYADVTNGSATGSGLTPDSAVTTLALALAASAANDIISIAPGTYPVDIGTNAIVPLANQTWMAGTPSYGGFPNVKIIADADDTAVSLFAIDVSGVVFKDLWFQMKASAATHVTLIDAAQTTAVNGLAFIDCWFDLNNQDDTGLMACQFDDATNAITGLVMRNCKFIGLDATTTAALAYINIAAGGIPYAMIEDCVFTVESIDGDNYAIAFADPVGGNKSYGLTIRNNDFIGASDNGADTVAIFFAGAMTDGEVMCSVRGNFFAGCTAVSITASKISKGAVRNFVTDGSGGALMDASA